jgi:hypothetical protein
MSDTGGSSSAETVDTQEVLDNPFHPDNLAALKAEYDAEEARQNNPNADEQEGGEEGENGGGTSTDADDSKKEGGAETKTDTPAEPVKLAGKFKSVEELERGYVELQNKLSSTRPADAANGGDNNTKHSQTEQQNTETAEKPKVSANGFPLDEHGLEVKPPAYWMGQRLSEYTEWYQRTGNNGEGMDEEDAKAAARIAVAQEHRNYLDGYQGARQEAAHKQYTAQEREVQRLVPLQAKEIETVEASVKAAFAKVFPEEGAAQITKAVFESAFAIVGGALEKKQISRLDAVQPQIVRHAVGEALKALVVEDKLGELFAQAAKGAGKALASGEAAIPITGKDKNGAAPQTLNGNGSGGGERGSTNGGGKVKVTPAALKFAKSLNITPEEAQKELDAIAAEGA